MYHCSRFWRPFSPFAKPGSRLDDLRHALGERIWRNSAFLDKGGCCAFVGREWDINTAYQSFIFIFIFSHIEDDNQM